VNIAPARPRTRDIATGNDVGVVVRRFYRAVIADPLLGPLFERYGVDWPHHIPKLETYWRRMLLDQTGPSVNTIAAHGPVQRSTPFDREHIDRWLELWEETLDDLYTGPVVEQAKARARQVGRALEAVAHRQRDDITEDANDGPH
jgi:hemoglobin